MSPRDGLFGFKMCKCFEIRAALSSFKRSSFSFGPKLLLKLEKSVREKLLSSVCPLQMCMLAPAEAASSYNEANAGGWIWIQGHAELHQVSPLTGHSTQLAT